MFKRLFGGADPHQIRSEVAARFEERLGLSGGGGSDVEARLSAATGAFLDRYGVPESELGQVYVDLEVLPFAFLPLTDCLQGLCEYALFKEAPKKAGTAGLTRLLSNGLLALMNDPSPDYDTRRLGLFNTLPKESFPWVSLLAERRAVLDVVYDGGQAALKRLQPRLQGGKA